MANTYTQISIQVIFAVQGRENIITKDWRDELHRYITGIIKAEGAKPLAVGGWKDHAHIFFGLQPSLSISDLVKTVKANSSRWINDKRLVKGKFNWQEGFGAFSYSKDQRDKIINYIMQQEEHHKKLSFRNEYLSLLQEFEIDFEEKYVFEFYE